MSKIIEWNDADLRQQMFSKGYFNGGNHGWGGYAREGYWDYPVHEITAGHILTRKPESVMELGAARGYVLKRIQDAGVYGVGIEISKHCFLTRVCENIILRDICQNPPWEIHTDPTVPKLDLCYSVAVLEHVPEQHLPAVIRQMAATCQRGLHGIDFHDTDYFDKTHVSIHPRDWWVKLFAEHAPNWPVEIVDKEELERGDFPPELHEDGGKVKLNIGSAWTMFHHGWWNIDMNDLSQFAGQHGYRFARHDIRNGIPAQTGTVDLVFAHHFLEHLDYRQATAFLRECRRVLKPETGAMRIAVPDAAFLMGCYVRPGINSDDSTCGRLEDFDEINNGCAASPTAAGKLWSLLHEGHLSCWDWETLFAATEEAGFDVALSQFRQCAINRTGLAEILKETIEMSYGGISLFCDCIPRTS